MAELRYDNLLRVLEEYGEAVAERYRDRVTAAGKNASGKLSDTVHSYIDRQGDMFNLWLSLEDYWQYLERGTRLQGPWRQRGKFPPLKPFVEWVKAKAIPLEGKTIEQKARQVAAGVYWHGTRPYWFLRDTLAEFPDIEEKVAEAIKEDIDNWFRELLAER